MKQKKLMLLGGSRYLLPAIEAAHKLGVYVITCDYLPQNYAHRFADLYCNISLLDTDALMAKAKDLNIDGVLGFANDIGVVPAAKIATEMGLPTPPLESVEILQNKDRFRDFLRRNGFNCPLFFSFVSKDEAMQSTELRRLIECGHSSVIVKPVDSCGSKGCTKVDRFEDLPQALDDAFSHCYNGRVIVEQFLELQGRQSGSDCFSVDNELVYCTFGSQYFDSEAKNPYAPMANTWPSVMPETYQDELTHEIQRLIRLLNLGTTIYNIESRVATDGRPYIIEVSPRAGGNCMSEVLCRATNQDIIMANVLGALGYKDELLRMNIKKPMYDGFWAYYVVHAYQDGVYRGVEIEPSFREKHLKLLDMYVKPGDSINSFTGANTALGIAFLRFDSRSSLDDAILHHREWIEVKVV